MDEMREVVTGMRDAGVLGGIRWAYLSATSRVLEDYSEAAGHDAAWLGITRFILFRDRLDRVFSCSKYAVPMGSTADAGRDVLHAELTPAEALAMPQLEPGLVTRENINGSPGWSWGPWLWLLTSASIGGIEDLRWPQASPTKQQIARRVVPDPAQDALFEMPDLEKEVDSMDLQRPDDLEILIIAHAQDVESSTVQAMLGRPKFNPYGGSAWKWNYDVLSTSPSGNRGSRLVPAPTAAPMVPDALVRLRRPAADATGLRAAETQ